GARSRKRDGDGIARRRQMETGNRLRRCLRRPRRRLSEAPTTGKQCKDTRDANTNAACCRVMLELLPCLGSLLEMGPGELRRRRQRRGRVHALNYIECPTISSVGMG